jgi:hypothetical protein
MERLARGFAIGLVALAFLASAYLGSYMVLLDGHRKVWREQDRGDDNPSFSPPHYLFGGAAAESIFWPANRLDRVVRPHEWYRRPYGDHRRRLPADPETHTQDTPRITYQP